MIVPGTADSASSIVACTDELPCLGKHQRGMPVHCNDQHGLETYRSNTAINVLVLEKQGKQGIHGILFVYKTL